MKNSLINKKGLQHAMFSVLTGQEEKLHKLNFCNFLVDIFFKCSYQVDTRIDKHQSIFSYCFFNCGISSEGATLSRWKQRGDKSKKPIAFIVCLHLFLACKISLICGIFFICIQNNILVKFQNLMFYLIYIYDRTHARTHLSIGLEWKSGCQA